MPKNYNIRGCRLNLEVDRVPYQPSLDRSSFSTRRYVKVNDAKTRYETEMHLSGLTL